MTAAAQIFPSLEYVEILQVPGDRLEPSAGVLGGGMGGGHTLGNDI